MQWLAGATSADYQPSQNILVYDNGGGYLASGLQASFHTGDQPSYPAQESLAPLVGADPNVLWELLVHADSLVDPSGSFVQWCLVFDPTPSLPYCESPGLPLHRGQGLVGSIDLRRAGLPTNRGMELSVNLSGALYGVRLTLQTRARAGDAVDGVALYGYDYGEWRQLATEVGSGTVPAWLYWTSNDSAEAMRLLSGQSRVIAFGAVPLGTNGMLSSGATVASDYVEVTVRYRASEME